MSVIRASAGKGQYRFTKIVAVKLEAKYMSMFIVATFNI